MRVRISYAVDLDSIPELVQREFGNTLPQLMSSIESLQTSTDLLNLVKEAPEASPELCKKLISDIVELREAMAKTEQVLIDFASIINGFEGAVSGPAPFKDLNQATPPAPESQDE